MRAIMPAFSRSVWRAAIASALILLVGIHALLAGKEGLSNIYALLAYQELNHPSMTEQRFRVDGGARAMQYLTESLRYSPNNAWALEQMGALQLRRMKIFTGPLQALNALNAARSANLHAHRALLERPTSPYIWANLALSKLSLNEQDGELLQALRRADELGPGEPEVQKMVIYVSLAVWNRLDPAQQASVVRTMERGAQRDPGTIANIAKGFNRFDLICAINKLKSVVGKACNPVKKSKKMANRS